MSETTESVERGAGPTPLAAAPVAPVAAVVAAPRKPPVKLPETGEALPWQSSHDIKKESNPFTDRDWRMLAYAWSGFLLRIVLVLGACFSVYQFLAAREEKRVERTLQLVELWEQDGYQQAQKALKTRLAALNAQYAALLGENLTQRERALIYDRIGQQALTEKGGALPVAEFQDHFDKIVYFLNRMSFCIEGDLCSRKVADAYFRDFAVSFWAYFSGYIERQRKAGSSTYALPIETYVLSDVATPGVPSSPSDPTPGPEEQQPAESAPATPQPPASTSQ